MNKFSDGFPTSDDRDEIEELMINHVIEGLDMSSLVQFAREALYKAYADYTDNDLLEEVERFAPHLLEEYDDLEDEEETESSMMDEYIDQHRSNKEGL